jgi:hypothetical protein
MWTGDPSLIVSFPVSRYTSRSYKLKRTRLALQPFLPSSSKGSSWIRQPRIGGTSTSPLPENSPQFRLEEPERSPAAALVAIREQSLHHQFGDFDDHLEDVTIDWLRNSGVNYLI